MRNYKRKNDTDIDFAELVAIADPITKAIPHIPLKLRDETNKKPQQVSNKPAKVAEKNCPPAAEAEPSDSTKSPPAAEAEPSASKNCQPPAETEPSASKNCQPPAKVKPSNAKGKASQNLKRFKSPPSKLGASTVTVLAQILTIFKLINFKNIVEKLGTDKFSKTFNSWSHLVSMMFAQLSGASSLRELVFGLQLAGGSLFQLGMNKPPTRSNLSETNSKRTWTFFQQIFSQLQAKLTSMIYQRDGFSKKFKFKHKLYSLDSSTISLSLEVYNWAKYKSTKGAIKLHCMLDHDTYLPSFAVVTTANKADVTIAQKIRYPKNSIVVWDRAYEKFDFYYKLTKQGTYFVSRLKQNVLYEVVESFSVPNPPGRPKKFEDSENDYPKPQVVKDEHIILSKPKTAEAYPDILRLVTAIVKDDRTGELMEMAFITNIFHLSPSTIAAVYKDRWQVEAFFRKIKQNLKIKTFLGTSQNAVKLQVWVALITMLLLEYLKFQSKLNWHISTLAYVLRLNLHAYINLIDLINRPERFKELNKLRHDPDAPVTRPLF
jgi:hypothetical protein